MLFEPSIVEIKRKYDQQLINNKSDVDSHYHINEIFGQEKDQEKQDAEMEQE